jgi:hypothetical protein
LRKGGRLSRSRPDEASGAPRLAVALAVLALIPAACGDRAVSEKPPAGEATAPAPQAAAGDLAVWREFVAVMRTGGLPSEKVRPYYEQLREPILGWLKEMSAKATWTEWERAPEVHRIGDQVHFLIPLTFDGRTADYCLTFLVEGGAWSFRHLEAITLRLDKTGPLPTSDFPDVDGPTKAHIREEWRWSREVRLFNLVAELKGEDYAFAIFKDGDGYFMAAKTWVPFVEPWRAFILYACWEQAKLVGNTVTLEKLDEREAVIRMSTYFFGLYEVTAHLSRQISFDDYKRIFETIWKDRARAAGWTLEIEYGNEGFPASECVLRFTKPS